MHLTYVALHEVTWCMAVWCTQKPPRWQQFQALSVHQFEGYSKTRYKKLFTHGEITCERSESARERRIALYKSDQQQLQLLIVQELCESRGGRPELSVLTSLLVSVDVKNY